MELARLDNQAFNNYDRGTNFAPVQLKKIIGVDFNVPFLRSMADDVGIWTQLRCPRNWRRVEPLLMRYLTDNLPLVIDKWAAGAFTVQKPPSSSPTPPVAIAEPHPRPETAPEAATDQPIPRLEYFDLGADFSQMDGDGTIVPDIGDPLFPFFDGFKLR
jgi:hypothetical protein